MFAQPTLFHSRFDHINSVRSGLRFCRRRRRRRRRPADTDRHPSPTELLHQNQQQRFGAKITLKLALVFHSIWSVNKSCQIIKGSDLVLIGNMHLPVHSSISLSRLTPGRVNPKVYIFIR
jgi:hypothetical protein